MCSHGQQHKQTGRARGCPDLHVACAGSRFRVGTAATTTAGPLHLRHRPGRRHQARRGVIALQRCSCQPAGSRARAAAGMSSPLLPIHCWARGSGMGSRCAALCCAGHTLESVSGTSAVAAGSAPSAGEAVACSAAPHQGRAPAGSGSACARWQCTDICRAVICRAWGPMQCDMLRGRPQGSLRRPGRRTSPHCWLPGPQALPAALTGPLGQLSAIRWPACRGRSGYACTCRVRLPEPAGAAPCRAAGVGHAFVQQ